MRGDREGRVGGRGGDPAGPRQDFDPGAPSAGGGVPRRPPVEQLLTPSSPRGTAPLSYFQGC